MACKYCDNRTITNGDENNYPVMTSDTVTVLGNSIFLCIDINGNNLCLNGGEYDEIITTQINYCPMCGEKLARKENDNA